MPKGGKKDSSKKEATSKPAAADATKTTEKSGPVFFRFLCP